MTLFKYGFKNSTQQQQNQSSERARKNLDQINATLDEKIEEHSREYHARNPKVSEFVSREQNKQISDF